MHLCRIYIWRLSKNADSFFDGTQSYGMSLEIEPYFVLYHRHWYQLSSLQLATAPQIAGVRGQLKHNVVLHWL